MPSGRLVRRRLPCLCPASSSALSPLSFALSLSSPFESKLRCSSAISVTPSRLNLHSRTPPHCRPQTLSPCFLDSLSPTATSGESFLIDRRRRQGRSRPRSWAHHHSQHRQPPLRFACLYLSCPCLAPMAFEMCLDHAIYPCGAVL